MVQFQWLLKFHCSSLPIKMIKLKLFLCLTWTLLLKFSISNDTVIPDGVPVFGALEEGMKKLAEVLNLRGVSEKVLQVKLFLWIYTSSVYSHAQYKFQDLGNSWWIILVTLAAARYAHYVTLDFNINLECVDRLASVQINAVDVWALPDGENSLVTLLWIVLMKFLAGVMVWTSLVLSIALLTASCVYCTLQYMNISNQTKNR